MLQRTMVHAWDACISPNSVKGCVVPPMHPAIMLLVRSCKECFWSHPSHYLSSEKHTSLPENVSSVAPAELN